MGCKCEKKDCFAIKNGKCGCLTHVDTGCKFYKTKDRLELDRWKAKARLFKCGRKDLYDKYAEKYYGDGYYE